MHTCQIQWVDDQGKPTPDSNPAVAIAVCVIDYVGDQSRRVTRKRICGVHLQELRAMVAAGPNRGPFYVSQWNEEGLCDAIPTPIADPETTPIPAQSMTDLVFGKDA